MLAKRDPRSTYPRTLEEGGGTQTQSGVPSLVCGSQVLGLNGKHGMGVERYDRSESRRKSRVAILCHSLNFKVFYLQIFSLLGLPFREK